MGPSIVQLDDEQARCWIEANASLFNIVIDSFSSRKTLQDLTDRLQDLIDAQIDADRTGEDARYHAASVGFHKTIIEHCANPIIRDYTMKTQNQINLCTFSYMATLKNRRESITAHSKIKNALAAGDIEEAKRLMERKLLHKNEKQFF